MFHKAAVDGTSQQIPEYQQHLELSEMQYKKLNRKEVVNISQGMLHECGYCLKLQIKQPAFKLYNLFFLYNKKQRDNDHQQYHGNKLVRYTQYNQAVWIGCIQYG